MNIHIKHTSGIIFHIVLGNTQYLIVYNRERIHKHMAHEH